MIRNLLQDIEASVHGKLFHVGLLAALTFPDIAGALDSENGRANPKKYERWFDEYVAPKYIPPKYIACGDKPLITGKDCYQYRCKLLHQGQVIHSKSRYAKSLFLFTKLDNVAYCGALALDDGQTLTIDIPFFCRNMVMGAYAWLDKVEETSRFKERSAQLMDLFQLSFGN